MSRQWTCGGCKTKWPRTKQKCTCGRKRPAARKPAHAAVLEAPYEEWVAEFGDACNICGAKQPDGGRRLHRDHCHATGVRRGILCFRCNTALPNRVDADWLERAAEYVRRTETREVA
jgi:hypothetical protein